MTQKIRPSSEMKSMLERARYTTPKSKFDRKLDQPLESPERKKSDTFLNIEYTSEADLKGSDKAIHEKVMNKLKLYCKTLPDERIIPYLILMFKDFEYVKTKFPLSNFPFTDKNANTIFGVNTKKNYIFNLACQEVCKSYTESQKKTLSDFLMKSGIDEKTFDLSSKIEIQTLIFKIPLSLPLHDLMFCMGLFDIEPDQEYVSAAAAAGGSRYRKKY
jgi:hypothetical protein